MDATTPLKSGSLIIWVEDEPDLRSAFGHILRFGDFDFDMASTALEGLALYKKALAEVEVLVLVLDVAMPDHTGLWLARQVRESGDFATKIVFVTAYDRVMNRHGAEDVNAFAYLRKATPDVEPARIFALLRQAIQSPLSKC